MRVVTLVCCLAMIGTGCGSDPSNAVSDPRRAAASITLRLSSSDQLASAGDSVVVTAVVKDANQIAIAGSAVSWRSSAPGVAIVLGSGESAIVQAVDDGTTTITATSGSAQQTIPVTVHRKLVSLSLSVPDSVLTAATTTQLTVVGRDARRHPLGGALAGVTYTTSNPFSVGVSPSGLLTGYFSSKSPFSSNITATVTNGGVTRTGTKHIDVVNNEPSTFEFAPLMLPEDVRPDPVINELSDGIIYFTLNGPRVDYKIVWSLLSGPPVTAHLHGPDGFDFPADVLVELPVGDHANTFGSVTGSFTAADIHSQGGKPPIALDSLIVLMRNHFTYVDMHTAKYTDGEIRGPIFPHAPQQQSITGASTAGQVSSDAKGVWHR